MESSSSSDESDQVRIQRQEVIAELGQQALETSDLDQFLAAATEAVAEALDVSHAGLFEVLPDGGELRLRHGVGWRDDLNGTAVVASSQDGTDGHLLLSDDEVTIDDLRRDERVSTSDVFAGHDFESSLSVTIDAADAPWGALAVFSPEQRAFSERDRSFVENVTGIVESAIESAQNRGDIEEIYGRISDAFFALDEEWQFTYLNERAYELINPEEQTLIGKNIWEVFPEATSRGFKPKYEEAMYEQDPVSFEEYYPDPLDAWFEVRAYPSETGLSVYFRDITDRKEREQELELFRTLLDQSTDSVLVIDPETGRYVDVNDTACRRHGYSREEFLQLTVPDVETELPDREAWQEFVEELRTDGSITFDGTHRRKDGTTYPVEVNVAYVDVDQEYVLAISRDVTERKKRERELEESRQRYRTLAEHFPNGAVALVDDDRRYYAVGGSPDEVAGVSAEEIEGQPVEEALPAELAHDLVPRYEAAFDGDAGSFETTLDGRTYQFHVVPVRDDDGEVFAALGMSQDITDRKRAERELQRSNEQLETLFEVLPVGAVVAEADGELVAANETAKEIWGGDVFDADSVAEYEKFDVWWADSGERVPPDEVTLARVLDGEEVTDPDIFEIEAFDGERRIIRAEGMPIRNADGEVVRGVITLSDITERREAQRRLEESEQRYRTLAENFPEGAVGLYDENLEYTAAGGQLLEEVGVSSEERVGNSVYELYPDEMVSELGPHFEGALDGERSSFEVEFYGRNLLAHTLPVRDADGEVSGGMVVVQDITERKERERQLEQLVDKLEVSNDRLEQFAYAVSHDLQEPLRMVSSYLQLIERRYADELDEDGQEFIDYAVDGADRMRQMIDGLLEYSRVETRGDPFEPVDLDAVLDDVRQDLRVRIEESDAEITSDDLPVVAGDEDQLRQVFQNLLDNAIEYSGDEPPRIHVAAQRREPERRSAADLPQSVDGDNEWVISVRDEGIGLDPDDADRVFDLFQRLHSRDEHEGTGIGLALCERIVDRHGGDIWVDAETGEGATFSFTLPAAPENR